MPVIIYHPPTPEQNEPARYELARQDEEYANYAGRKLAELCLVLSLDKILATENIRSDDIQGMGYKPNLMLAGFEDYIERDIEDVEQGIELSRSMLDLNPNDIDPRGIKFILDDAYDIGDHYTESGLILVDPDSYLITDIEEERIDDPIMQTRTINLDEALLTGVGIRYGIDHEVANALRAHADEAGNVAGRELVQVCDLRVDEVGTHASTKHHVSLGYIENGAYIPVTVARQESYIPVNAARSGV